MIWQYAYVYLPIYVLATDLIIYIYCIYIHILYINIYQCHVYNIFQVFYIYIYIHMLYKGGGCTALCGLFNISDYLCMHKQFNVKSDK